MSASLYYVFTYMFLVIGTFAVITVVAGPGDKRSKISDYRGLAKRQPLLALAFAVLLLGQAGAPFTTGFLAKLGVIEASVSGQGYTLAVIAMASAAVAAFFYLRLAVTMFSPVGDVGNQSEDADGGPVEGDGVDQAEVRQASVADRGDAIDDRVSSLQVLTDAPPDADVEDRGPVPVPVLTAVVIGTCVAFTLVFGIIPGPILNFAHEATLLLLG